MDRAALDAATDSGIEHGGWCPSGRRAEDGIIAPGYALRETESTVYAERTRRNVDAADGTLLIHGARLATGTCLTLDVARSLCRPVFCTRGEPVGTSDRVMVTATAVARWCRRHGIRTLNVAGPRHSQWHGGYVATRRLLREVFHELQPGNQPKGNQHEVI